MRLFLIAEIVLAFLVVLACIIVFSANGAVLTGLLILMIGIGLVGWGALKC